MLLLEANSYLPFIQCSCLYNELPAFLHVVIFYITHPFLQVCTQGHHHCWNFGHCPLSQDKKKLHFTGRISFHLSSPSLFHLNMEADPVPERWDYFKAQTMGNV